MKYPCTKIWYKKKIIKYCNFRKIRKPQPNNNSKLINRNKTIKPMVQIN